MPRAPHWERVEFMDDAGRPRQGAAPVIISASRATDIPAFHGDWLLDRLRRGYCEWVNPFNGAVQFISFPKTRFIVFWTKNPAPMLDKLPALDRLGLGFYFQFTLNDYDAERFEPRVPPVAARIATFKRLADLIGPHRVIWRFDPLLLTDKLSMDELARRIERLMRQLQGYTEKLVVSFADIDSYQKVQRNLSRVGIKVREFTRAEMMWMGERLGALAASHEMRAATCAEPVDLGRFGVEHNHCVDDRLIARCAPADAALLAFLAKNAGRKDPGQRPACGCVPSKDIGAYNTCPHTCVYCYASNYFRGPSAQIFRRLPDSPNGKIV